MIDQTVSTKWNKVQVLHTSLWIYSHNIHCPTYQRLYLGGWWKLYWMLSDMWDRWTIGGLAIHCNVICTFISGVQMSEIYCVNNKMQKRVRDDHCKHLPKDKLPIVIRQCSNPECAYEWVKFHLLDQSISSENHNIICMFIAVLLINCNTL